MTTSKSCCFNPFVRNRTNSYRMIGRGLQKNGQRHLHESLHESHLLHAKAFITFLVFNNSLLLCKLFLLNNFFYNSVACITGALWGKRGERGIFSPSASRGVEKKQSFIVSPPLAIRTHLARGTKCRVCLVWFLKYLLCRLTIRW